MKCRGREILEFVVAGTSTTKGGIDRRIGVLGGEKKQRGGGDTERPQSRSTQT